MSVQRRDLVKYFEENGFYPLREGKKHSIYTNGVKTLPIKRHSIIDRITANELCKQAGLIPRFNNPEGNRLEIGKVQLTQAGTELARVCEQKYIDGFYDFVIQFWSKQGIKIDQ